MSWTADITTDRHSRLYLELLENDRARGRIERIDGEVVLVVYDTNATIPVRWLRSILVDVESVVGRRGDEA